MNKNCLIGYTGFVGSTLLELKQFNYKYNRNNIHQAKDCEFDTVYCAAPSAVKWKANKYPEEDYLHTYSLIENIKNIKTNKFILFSTVDVYSETQNVDEDCEMPIQNDNAYGKNRKMIENFVESNFSDSIIIRLPALFGQKMKKNYIFDLLNDNNLSQINLNSSFQWYDISRIEKDLEVIIKNNIKKINISPEPLKTENIVDLFFKQKKKFCYYGNQSEYNIKTKYFNIFNGENGYSRTKKQVLEDFSKFFGN